MDFSNINYLFSLSGFAVGIIVGLTGVGGGSLMTPILIWLFAIEPSKAVGTDLLYAAFTKSVGTGVHGRNDSVDWTVVRRLATGSVPATLLTFALMVHFHMATQKSGILVTALACVLIATSLTMLFRSKIVAFLLQVIDGTKDTTIAALTVVIGAILGVLVTMTSVGAGAIGVTALLVLYPRLPTVRIVGSDIAHAVPLTLIAGLGHWIFLNDVDFVMLGSLLIGSIPGIVIGATLAPRLPETGLRTILAVILFAVSLKLFGLY
jgi:uncharacterized protein